MRASKGLTACIGPTSVAAVNELSSGEIVIRGAAEHNLQHVDLTLPKHRLIVFTGVSGSGKSSLAFDTLYAEGQRRYIESLSAYARQFLGQMEKPKYDTIRGLSPTISIEQRSGSANPRSTVGTVTEIYDYLRVLFARAGSTHCHQCGRPADKSDATQMVKSIEALGEGARVLVMAPIARQRKGTFKDELEGLRTQGYGRARIDGEVTTLETIPELDKNKKHTIDVVVDRLVVRAGGTPRLTDSVETALKLGEGKLTLQVQDGPPNHDTERLYSEARHCAYCDLSLPEPVPALFSFNSPLGACPTCNGLGTAHEIDLDAVVPDSARSLRQGCIAPWNEGFIAPEANWTRAILEGLGKTYGIDLDAPWADLAPGQREKVLNGTSGTPIEVVFDGKGGKTSIPMPFEGVIGALARKFRESRSDGAMDLYRGYFVERRCKTCDGTRLRPEARSTRVGGRAITDLVSMTVGRLHELFGTIALEGNAKVIAAEVLREVRARLGFLVNVGLDYLTLDRTAGTLSGGEAQRIRLASQVGSELTGVLYVLDEPSIGLHARDNLRLIETLRRLRDVGNTVIVVEHDAETMLASDWLVDFGPGAGRLGGHVVASGTAQDVMRAPGSLTGAYLSGARRIAVPAKRRPRGKHAIVVRNARAHNLKGIDVALPLGCMTAITGVSGAGKSSLINAILYPALARRLYKAVGPVAEHDGIDGLEHIDKVVDIDQKPIGRTPRSNPATYTKLFDLVRSVFAATRESRTYGYGPGRFSFNVKGGRCEACEGAGVIKIEMHFLADVYVRCETCRGRRFNDATLRVHYREKTIFDVLESTVDDAAELFSAHKGISHVLRTLQDVGLGYVTLGQPATTLSGGEAQRVKLSRELAKSGTGRTLYILDEPSTGLHFEDVRRLLEVVGKLVDAGNTVVMIEHNLDIIKTADWVVDLGPEGGDGGGHLVAEGTPETVAGVAQSYTGQHLARLLGRELTSPAHAG